MKRSLLTLAIMLLAVAAQAQIKVHDDNWVSIGCLNGNFGLQVTPSGYIYYRTQSSSNFSWATLSMANQAKQKHWIVENHYNDSIHCVGKHMFFVYGNGSVHYTSLACIDNNKCLDDSRTINSEDALSTILNINGYYFGENDSTTPEEIENSEYINSEAVAGMINDLEKNRVALSADNLVEAFPDAVRTDPEARLCIDYNAVVTMLVEAVKQQQTEITLLRKTLEENGFLEQEKR